MRLYLYFNLLVNKSIALIYALHQGIWLGFTNKQTLNSIASHQYQNWNKYTDKKYNLSGFLCWEREVIEQYFSKNDNVLVAAAGGGREVIALHRNGYKADGFDCVNKLVQVAKKLLESENINCNYLTSDPDMVPSDLDVYQGAIIGWGGYMHIYGRENRISFLKQMHKHLTNHAPLMLSFFTRTQNSNKHILIYYIANGLKKIQFSQERLEIGDMLNGTFDHHFTEREIKDELNEAGYELLFFSEENYGHAIARVI